MAGHGVLFKTDQSKNWSPEWDAKVIKFVFASKRKSQHHGPSFAPAPQEHVFERRVEELDEAIVRGYGEMANPVAEKDGVRPPIYPVAWGWNAGGRSGNSTARELREPRYTLKSGMRQYISASAGTHHSLLVSDDNIVYSFGEGRSGQLGYGNDFMHQPGVKPPKGGLAQSCPRAVTPSGNIQFGHDLKIAQVACGARFSISREVTASEGVSMVKGLEASEQALIALKRVFFDSDKVHWAWSNVRQERFRVNRVSEGHVTSWGTGKHGELGLGQFQLFSPRPRIIPRLRHISIAQISAGKMHVLAVSTTGYIYSWGSGRAGKLGHGDWEDRHAPLMIKFFESFFVEYCAAGDAHSAVLTTNRKGVRETQLKRVSTFGRGAHGRLGNNKNKSSFTPVVVSVWPPSIEGAQFHSIACGGAHTVALASIGLPKTKANPWGIQTFVLAWGYGGNGQLGTGYQFDSFVPVRSRLPRAVIVAEVSAGKSWTMARTNGGELYTWGKGMRGQLGLGKTKFSFAPRKLRTFASFVKLSSGYAHNLCLSAQKKFFGPKTAQMAAATQQHALTPLVPLAIKQQESVSYYSFDCCRRHLHPDRAKRRFICNTCGITSLCYDCAKQCHRDHGLLERRPVAKKSKETNNPLRKKRLAKKGGKSKKLDSKKVMRLKMKTAKAQAEQTPKKSKKSSKKKSAEQLSKVKVPFCRCGMFNSKCRLIPVIPEGDEENDAAAKSLRFIAAGRIQKLARVYIYRQRVFLKQEEAAMVRREVCAAHWNTRILKKIWARLERARQKFREDRENEEMFIEEATRRRFDYFYCLQTAVGGMDAIVFGTKALMGSQSIMVPRVHRREVTEEFRPSFAFTWAGVRQQQLNLHPFRRIPLDVLAEVTKNIARFEEHEGQLYDPDVTLLGRRFMRDAKTEKFRTDQEKILQHREEAKRIREERAKAALMAIKFASKNAVQRALAITRPTPPVLPPPPHVLAAQAAARKAEKKRLEREALLEQERLEDAPFDMYSKTKKPRVYRRNSIAAPEKLYSRFVEVVAHTPLRSFSKRRNSLPANCALFFPFERPSYSHVPSIRDSLSLFALRDDIFDRFLNPKYERMIETMKTKVRRRRIAEVMGSAALTPSLPIEMKTMITDGYRRRTIAEPERLAKQLHVMFETRNKWEDLRTNIKDDERMTFRRRSFDHGEITDSLKDITDTLGYEFEEPWRKPKIMDLRKDSAKMEKSMIECGFIVSKSPTFKSKNFGNFIKRNLEDEDEAAKREEAKRLAATAKAVPTNRLANIRAAASSGSNPSAYSALGYNENNPSAPPLTTSSVWQEHFTENGETYYYCPQSGESSWEYPQGDGIQLLSQYTDDKGFVYWYNWSTGDSWYE